MFEILGMRRIHSIHGPHATDVYVYFHQAGDNPIDFSLLITLLLSVKHNIFYYIIITITILLLRVQSYVLTYIWDWRENSLESCYYVRIVLRKFESDFNTCLLASVSKRQ